jgi:membrane associated rhomboid family serine protease
MNQASVGFHCPECTRKGGQRVYTARSLVTTPYVTIAIISAAIVVYILELASGAEAGLWGGGESLGASIGDTGLDLALYGPATAADDWWRPLTVGFVHAGLLHIGFNMFLLYQLGLLLEPALGRIAFTALFGASLLGGSLLVLVLDPDTPTVGASGAVFGLMGAAALGLRARGISPFSTSIGTLLILNLIFTFRPGVSIGGHIGGLAAGLAAGALLFYVAPQINGNGTNSRPAGRTYTIGHWWATALCLALAVVLYGACLYVANNPL